MLTIDEWRAGLKVGDEVGVVVERRYGFDRFYRPRVATVEKISPKPTGGITIALGADRLVFRGKYARNNFVPVDDAWRARVAEADRRVDRAQRLARVFGILDRIAAARRDWGQPSEAAEDALMALESGLAEAARKIGAYQEERAKKAADDA